MKKKIILTAVAAAVIAVGARAQTIIQAPAGQAFTIINNVSASAVTEVTYQWYRDNNPISGATKESYTVPAAQAYGDNVAFYRMATAQECAGVAEKKSNIVTITFTGYVIPAGCNLVISGICWANAHIDEPNTFAAQPDMNTKFYQWNRLTAYSASEPLTPAWNATPDSSATWTVNPCPQNWRLPSSDEYRQLHNSSSTWVDAGTRGASIAGRFYGYNHTSCTLPTNMNGCVFFPASGYRSNANGALVYRGINGTGWSSTQVSSANGYNLSFSSTNSNPADNSSKAYGFPIRCVR